MDDDWDDEFGGFEGATPAPPELGQPSNVEASPSPWAAFALAAQPDLLQAQMPSPQVPKPSPATPFDDPIPQSSLTSERNVLPDNKGSNDLPESDRNDRPHNGGLDSIDINLDLEDDNLDLFPPEPTNQNVHISQEFPHPESIPALPVSAAPSSSLTSDLRASQTPSNSSSSNPDLEQKVTRLEEALSTAELERRNLIKQKEELMEKVTNLEKEVQNRTEALESQRLKYDEVQRKHESQLAEIRKAGHDTLAVMVEEYKELCRCTVLQQQEQSEKQLSALVAKETADFQDMLKKQQEVIAATLEEDRRKNEERLKQALEKYADLHRKKLEKLIEEERQRGLEAQEGAQKKYEKEQQEAISKAIQEERLQGQTLLEGQRSELKAAVEEERLQSKEMIERALEEERTKSQEAIKVALIEEREAQKDLMKKAIQAAQVEMKQAFDEQRQEESQLRQRSLSTMDLFLRGTQEQLKLLIESPFTKNDTPKPS